MYLFDSDIFRLYIRSADQYPQLIARVDQTPWSRIYLSSIAVLESIQGAMGLMGKSEIRAHQVLSEIIPTLARFQVWPYDSAAAAVFDKMSAETKRIGRNDCKIAASAVAHGLIVVTRNVQHFEKIEPPVKIEDWTR